jgi:hypothetical protein
MRTITESELLSVYGGEIVVTANKKFDYSIYQNSDGSFIGTAFVAPDWFQSGGGGGSGSVTVDIGEPVKSDSVLVDTDGDGVPDSPDIVVEGPPRMADNWEELGASEKAHWLAGFVVSGGNDVVADVGVGSDLSGGNPDNPYQSEEEALEDYENLAGDAMEGAADTIGNYPIP